MKNTFTSISVKQLLQKRYDSQQWALFFEVPDSTGGANRRADAMAFNLWPSRGLEVHGFEIKVSRSDWLNELKQDKSNNLQKFCDQWFIVAPAGIVKEEELPKTWGLLEINHETKEMRQKVKAPKLESVEFDSRFTMSLLRCATKDPEWYRSEIERINEENFKKLQEDRKENKEHYENRLKQETEWISEFKEKTGVSLHGYNKDQVLAFFEMFNDQKKIERFIENMRYDYDRLQTLMKSFEVLFKADPPKQSEVTQ